MPSSKHSEEELLQKVRSLPPERVAEIEDFVDFLRLRDEERRLTEAASRLSESAFDRVWKNPDNDDYDRV